MGVIDELTERQRNNDAPFLIGDAGRLAFSDVMAARGADLSEIHSGDVVALIGDFDSRNIATLLRLIDLRVILMPLTVETRSDHDYFFQCGLADLFKRVSGEKPMRSARKNPLRGWTG